MGAPPYLPHATGVLLVEWYTLPNSNPTSLDLARRLPHLRGGPRIEAYKRDRAQAAVLAAAMAEETEGKPLPIRVAMTKPGDPRQLRGIPAIGRSVGGAIPGTQPGG